MRVLLFLMIGGALWAQAPAAPVKPAAAAPVKPAASPAAGSADPVVLTAGSTRMTKSEFEALVKNLPDSIRGQIGGDTPEARRRFAEQFGEVILFASEARKRGLDSTPTAKAQAFLQEQSLLAGLLYQQMLAANKPTEEASKAWYDAHKADYEQAKARHILIRFKGSPVAVKPNQQDLGEEDALARTKAIRERLVKGEDFAAVARAESDDAGSGAQGGDLGVFGRGRMVPVFDEAAFKLPIGEVSQPVKSQFGWHLIQVQDRTARSFAEVKAEIEKRLQTENAQKAMQAFKSSTKPVLDEAYFGKPAPAAAPPAAPPGQPPK
ncbi:MAG: peptidyl-prolyl cis-trans isomerase [Acidobacteria bacterium]|nr:peptidyl-prolyl cis-trans isomerase [Acidobacteriota bacterium]